MFCFFLQLQLNQQLILMLHYTISLVKQNNVLKIAYNTLFQIILSMKC